MNTIDTVSEVLKLALLHEVKDDSIHECGKSCLDIIKTRPQDVIDFAYEKLSTWPFIKSPACWRRLYEEASLFKALQVVKATHDFYCGSSPQRAKRRRLDIPDENVDLSQLIAILDKTIMISGAPGRLDTIHEMLDLLHHINYQDPDPPTSFPIEVPHALTSRSGQRVNTAPKRMTIDGFQEYVNEAARPIIIPGVVNTWPAFKIWPKPAFWFSISLGGRRLVPVEVGRSYTDGDWGQRLMTFREFLDHHLLNPTPESVGYLAQHDLFEQFPPLSIQILYPDYCYLSPANADADTLTTAGLSSVQQLDDPIKNIWFGPKGTRTPLHTDPYHNILCQVVGYKYVRLYPPSATSKLYPCGVDEKGINMENTSRIDVSLVRPEAGQEEEAKRKIKQGFPLFAEARYLEGILEPGECLYIPLGWWHYVESLSTSISVSFWWN